MSGGRRCLLGSFRQIRLCRARLSPTHSGRKLTWKWSSVDPPECKHTPAAEASRIRKNAANVQRYPRNSSKQTSAEVVVQSCFSRLVLDATAENDAGGDPVARIWQTCAARVHHAPTVGWDSRVRVWLGKILQLAMASNGVKMTPNLM